MFRQLLRDLYADEQGGVVLLDRDSQGGGRLGCGALENLCGDLSSPSESVGSENGDVFLLRFSVSGSAPTLEESIDVAAQAGVNDLAPYLAPCGTDGLVAAWSVSDTSSSNARYLDGRDRHMYVQVRDRATGAAVGDALAVDVSTNAYQDFRASPDGSVAYPAEGDTSTSVKVLRILPCEG